MFDFFKSPKQFYFNMNCVNELTTIRHRWKGMPVREIGGLIFGRITGDGILMESIVEIANKYKILAHAAFDPERKAMMEMISKKKLEGLDLIGEWHTHPSGRIMLSTRDEEVMINKVSVMKNYMVMIMTERQIGMWYYKKGKVKSEQLI